MALKRISDYTTAVTIDGTELVEIETVGGESQNTTIQGIADFAALSAGSSAMVYVSTATVTGAAATTLTISGLDLDAHGSYYVELGLHHEGAGSSTISVYYNADTTATNYYVQNTSFTTTASAARANTSACLVIPTGTVGTARMWIQNDYDSKARMTFIGTENDDASLTTRSGCHRWTSTANVTGITISSSVASALSVGSFIKVFKITG